MINGNATGTSLSPWMCPQCGSRLVTEISLLACENGHCYDRAREGYVNLLLANQKNSRQPGDNAEMIAARRDFFKTPFYDPLFDAVERKITGRMLKLSTPLCLLDLGCGEGAYLRRIAQATEISRALARGDVTLLGVDISKVAVKRASKSLAQADFAVASSYNLPIPTSSVDIALNVFAPLKVTEVKRILKEDAMLVRVSPGRDHLKQLKQSIYAKGKDHESPQSLEGFTVVSEEFIHYSVMLSSQDLALLLAMTPLRWHGNQSAKESLLKRDCVELDFDFVLQYLTTPAHNDAEQGNPHADRIC